jgi:hypothetical protein
MYRGSARGKSAAESKHRERLHGKPTLSQRLSASYLFEATRIDHGGGKRRTLQFQSLSSSASVLPVVVLTRCCPPHARQLTSS